MKIYSLNIIPVAKPRMTQQDKWSDRPCVMHYRLFSNELSLLWGNKEIPQPCHLIFYLPMPRSWSKKKQKEKIGLPHDSRPDLDNLVKAFFDSLLTEDKHIYDFRASKYWGEKGVIEVRTI